MRAARTACTVAGTCDARDGLRQPIGAALADQHAGLDQRADALLEEERVALGPLDQQALERLEARVARRAAPASSSSALSGGSGSSRSCW